MAKSREGIRFGSDSKRKTDNASLEQKLAIRRWGIAQAGLTELRVWDLCTGLGLIWKAMRKESNVVAYTPCDVKPRMDGTIKGDATSERFLAAFSVDAFNVIDIDTYGEPWTPFFFLLPRIRKRTLFLLTNGTISLSGVPSHTVRRIAGIPTDWALPFKSELTNYLMDRMLSYAPQHANILKVGRLRIEKDHGRVDYFAIVCEGKQTDA